MKKGKFFVLFMFLCALSLIALVGNKPSFGYLYFPGYVMFKDDASHAIKSDNGGVYKDCSIGGTDSVIISIWDDGKGTFQGLLFYPGIMQNPFYNVSFSSSCSQHSSRSVNFNFNVSGITGGQTGVAVRDILRWYKDGSNYIERCTDYHGFILDNSLHAPMDLYRTGHAWVQFMIDKANDPLLAVTQENVDNFYPDDTNTAYRCFPDHGKNYVVYTLDYGKKGVEVTPIQWEYGKPITWIIKTKARIPGDPVRLYVINNKNGKVIYLASYSAGLPFELAVSLKPIVSYPANPAPPKNNTISTTWGEIKEK